ncbi:MAG: sensor histidine kinase [Oligoflexus sp.]
MMIFDFWRHPKSNDQLTGFGPRKLIISISYINILVSVSYFLINMKLGINSTFNLIQIFGSLATLFALKLFRSQEPAGHLFLALATLNAISLIIIFNSFPYTILLWVPIFSILAVYVVGIRWGGLWSLFTTSLSTIAVLYGSNFNDSPTQVNLADIPFIAASTLLMSSAVAYGASLLFAKSISQLTKTLESQNQELLKRNQTITSYAQDKAMLVSIVSHDIVSPLSLIMCCVDLAQKHPEKIPVYLERITRATNMIEEVTRNVREFESLDSGKKVVHVGTVDLKNIFDRAQFVFSERLQQKELTLEFSIANGVNTLVAAEESALSNSVVNNLISNAIKFSRPKQRIVISVEEEGDQVVLKVKDFGVGMSESIAKDLFNKKRPSTAVGTQGERGTGFGLPITKAYMDRFGGEINVLSQEEAHHPDDHGTTFILRFQKPK